MTDHRDVGDREEEIAKLGLDTLHDRNLFRKGWEAARRARFVEIDRLNAEWMAKCEELRKDAERYRKFVEIRDHYIWGECSPEDVARILDAAMAKKEGA